MKKVELIAVAQVAALQVLETMGITSGEITRNQAIKVYGQAFRQLEAAGLVRPVRGSAGGKYSHRYYRVADIVAAKAAAQAEAATQLCEIL